MKLVSPPMQKPAISHLSAPPSAKLFWPPPQQLFEWIGRLAQANECGPCHK